MPPSLPVSLALPPTHPPTRLNPAGHPLCPVPTAANPPEVSSAASQWAPSCHTTQSSMGPAGRREAATACAVGRCTSWQCGQRRTKRQWMPNGGCRAHTCSRPRRPCAQRGQQSAGAAVLLRPCPTPGPLASPVGACQLQQYQPVEVHTLVLVLLVQLRQQLHPGFQLLPQPPQLLVPDRRRMRLAERRRRRHRLGHRAALPLRPPLLSLPLQAVLQARGEELVGRLGAHPPVACASVEGGGCGGGEGARGTGQCCVAFLEGHARPSTGTGVARCQDQRRQRRQRRWRQQQQQQQQQQHEAPPPSPPLVHPPLGFCHRGLRRSLPPLSPTMHPSSSAWTTLAVSTSPLPVQSTTSTTCSGFAAGKGRPRPRHGQRRPLLQSTAARAVTQRAPGSSAPRRAA